MERNIAIIGLGYVGLPLARLFATKYQVRGYDNNKQRVAELQTGVDRTREVAYEMLQTVLVKNFHLKDKGLVCTSDARDIKECNYYIITVPTPIDKNNRPDLSPLKEASKTIGKLLKIGDIVIYESTVYPGVTEDECVPVLEKASGLKFNTDFFVGYSPERINPGDRQRTIENIIKVTSGSTPDIAKTIDELYNSVILAGTHLAPNIKVAEASKVIENAQRDINIAFVNELAKIFSLMDVSTHDVLAAAKTKWNFLSFKPGLVGGHCIGVDPFYLAQKAQEIGYYSELILTARRVNDSMGAFIAARVVKLMIKKGIQINGAEVLMLGITFKENCPDIRNTKVVDVVRSLEDYNIKVTTYDPWVDGEIVRKEYDLDCVSTLLCKTELAELYQSAPRYDAIILAVPHDEFLTLDLEALKKENAIVFDVKGVLLTNVEGKL